MSIPTDPASPDGAAAIPTDAGQPPAAERPALERNLLVLYGAEGIGKVLGMVTFGWLGHQLGKARFGDLEFAIAIWFVLNLVMEAGLGPFGAREAAKRPESTGRLAGIIISLRAMILVVSLGLLAAFAFGFAETPERRTLMLLFGLVLLPAPLELAWAFQARDRMSVVALANLARQTTLFAIVVLMVRGPHDARWAPIGDAVGIGLMVLIHHVCFRRGGDSLRLTAAIDKLRSVVSEAAPIAASSLAWAARIAFPTLALGIFATAEETGTYASGHRLVVAMHTFAWLYFFNLLPSISRASLRPGLDDFRRLMRLSISTVSWIVIPGCLALAVLAPLLLPAIYGSEFTDAADVFRILVWMPVIAFLSGHARFSLIAFGHGGAECRASVMGVLVSVVGCSVLGLLGRLDPYTAAWTFVASEATTLVFAQVLFARRVESLRLLRGMAPVLPAAIAGALVAALVVPASPILGAAAVLLIAGALVFVLDRGLIRELPALKRRLMPPATKADD